MKIRDKTAMEQKDNIILLKDYVEHVTETNRYGTDIKIVQQGLFGEVGSVMAVVKKRHRENTASPEFHEASLEEFGDSLWYFAAVCERLEHDLGDIFSHVIDKFGYAHSISTADSTTFPIARAYKSSDIPDLDTVLLKLGIATADILRLSTNSIKKETKNTLCDFAHIYMQSIQAAEIDFGEVVRRNIEKVRGRFLGTEINKLPIYDKGFDEEESLPENFEIKITQRKNGKTYLQWHDVFIGDPLTDNIHDEDGYRFHDVFHMANAAILHWSPTFRALIKHKRKSSEKHDEVEDGGRAIVIEEGLTAWIFSSAKRLEYFDGTDKISFNMLKTIQQFVRGYEIENCPLNQWEKAILEGYKVFRQVRDNNGGVIVGNIKERTITFKKP